MRAKTLLKAEFKERQACFSAQKIIQENYLADKEEAAKHNDAVREGKKKCNSYLSEILPSKPEFCLTSLKSPKIYEYELIEPERLMKELDGKIAIYKESSEKIEAILKLENVDENHVSERYRIDLTEI